MASGNTQYAIFPMAVMNITTKMNEGTHVGSYAIDIAGRNTGIESAFAPFTGVVKKIWANGNSVWLESVAPVELADGSTDFLTVLMTHDNDVRDLYIGKVIDQGVNFYQEGTAGNATGNHIHLNVGRGKFTGTGWFQNKYGYWVINNEIKPYDAFYLSGTEIKNNGGYPWKEYQGSKNTMIQNNDSEYARWNDLHWRVRNKNITRDVFNKDFVGQDERGIIDSICNNPEADLAKNWQVVGKVAVEGNWEGQIKLLTDENKKLKESGSGKPSDSDAKLQAIREALGIK